MHMWGQHQREAQLCLGNRAADGGWQHLDCHRRPGPPFHAQFLLLLLDSCKLADLLLGGGRVARTVVLDHAEQLPPGYGVICIGTAQLLEHCLRYVVCLRVLS